MTPPRAGKKSATPAKPTRYEISRQIVQRDAGGAIIDDRIAWHPVDHIETSGGALAALRAYATKDESYDGTEPLRAVPVGNITELAFDVAIERRLTPKVAPART